MYYQQDHPEITGLKADLHLHTDASFDCQTSVRKVLESAHAAGLNAIAITDHDSLAACRIAQELSGQYGLQVIPGVELTAEGGTHLLAYFIDELPHYRRLPELILWVREKGGISCLPHLHRSDTGLLYNHQSKGQFTAAQIRSILKSVDLIEGVNFKSVMRGEPSGMAVTSERGKPLLASSDAHYDVEIGKAFTIFALPPNQPLGQSQLLNARRELWGYNADSIPLKKQSALSSFEPSVERVSELKKVLGPLVPLAGRVLYSWQNQLCYRAKVSQIKELLARTPGPTRMGR